MTEAAGRSSAWAAPDRRRAGILLHPTSLPGPFGSGELGADAHAWLGFLQAAGQRLWQVLPLGPTGYGDSPYQSFSSFAGNPLLVSIGDLAAQDLLTADEIDPLRDLPGDHVHFGALIPLKRRLLELAAARFLERGDPEFASFRLENADWLADFALFMALKDEHGGGAWTGWPEGERTRDPAALAAARERNDVAISRICAQQYWFRTQWRALRAAAAARDILIMGDVPIFVAFDSADTWASQDLFDLDAGGHPRTVAGVPPDYFSATGQRWGNPLYLWERHAADGFAWWIRRVRANLELCDLLRIDHFRGFEAYWSIPATEDTAVRGEWLPGPGQALFTALRAALGGEPGGAEGQGHGAGGAHQDAHGGAPGDGAGYNLPLVAEDLGIITPDVEALRDANGLPGMRILQFAFGGDPRDPYLPHNHVRRCVVYTGTHDNDTTAGWYAAAPESERAMVRRYLGVADEDVPWALLRAACGSVAELALVPLQDVLRIGSEGRMNTPGRPAGNWSWRFSWEQVGEWAAPALRDVAEVFGRVG